MTQRPATFADLGLPADLLAHLSSRNIATPTPVQAAVIPLALDGLGGEAEGAERGGGDLLAQARTGSGKTLAFLLPLAAAVRAHECRRAWVVCPTRELAQQVSREAALVLGERAVATLIGGAPFGPQARELSGNPPLVVGTPGRMRDHRDRGTLAADAEVLVLDEADQMLDMGFREELDALVKDLGSSVARWLFSATFPPAVADAVARWLDKPREVRLDVRQASSHVPQKFVTTHRGGEVAALVRLLQVLEPARALAFTRTRVAVEETVQAIALAGIEAAGISGDLTQDARERVLSRFRDGKLPVLVATDVAARGLDVQGVSHVFNLGLPVGSASYGHRVGRTARAGAEGEAWSIITASERGRLLRMAASVGSQPQFATVPTAGEIVAARRRRLAVRVEESLGEGLALPAEFAALAAANGAEAVLAALVHRLVPDAPVEQRPPPRPATHQRPTGATVDLFLGVGEDDGATPGTVVAIVCRGAGIDGSRLGRLRLFPRHTLLSVVEDVAERVLGAALHYRGRRIPVRPDQHGPRRRH
jgi:ATP-dependent RNA helicase DeaD